MPRLIPTRPISRKKWSSRIKNRRTSEFRKQFELLPERIRLAAGAAFRAFEVDPADPVLDHRELKDTKKGRHKRGSFKVNVTYRYRAIYVPVDDVNVWYWIGSHEDYNNFTGLK